MTLPQEHFDLIERAAVSKRPHRVINLRLVNSGAGDLDRSLSFSNAVRNGTSAITSSIERQIAYNLSWALSSLFKKKSKLRRISRGMTTTKTGSAIVLQVVGGHT